MLIYIPLFNHQYNIRDKIRRFLKTIIECKMKTTEQIAIMTAKHIIILNKVHMICLHSHYFWFACRHGPCSWTQFSPLFQETLDNLNIFASNCSVQWPHTVDINVFDYRSPV